MVLPTPDCIFVSKQKDHIRVTESDAIECLIRAMEQTNAEHFAGRSNRRMATINDCARLDALQGTVLAGLNY